MGLPLRDVTEHNLLSDGVEESAIAEKYYDPPLINIIKYACNGCTPTHFEVTNACQGCLSKHCSYNCPRGAITFNHGKAEIDQTKCIKCGKCKNACSYGAIIRFTRPCEEACGMDAIGRDEHGRAEINYDKCVSCGMCLVNCPFGAIVDKGQMFLVIHAIKRGDKVIPIIAPAFWGQFGDKVTAGQLKTAMEMLGFCGIEEVAIGADLCAIEEAEEFLESVPEKQPFMGTSCCPAWSVMAKTEFPGFAPYISMTMTPMVLTARLVKRRNPGCRIAFIGPCAAKKLEASRRSVRSEVDFVLTFEELRGMFEAKDIDLEKVEDSPRTMRRPRPAWVLPPAAAWRRRLRTSFTACTRRWRSRPSRPTACASAARCCASPARASTTVICSRAWHAPAGASRVPVRSSRSKSPAARSRNTSPRCRSRIRSTRSISRTSP